MGDLSRNRVCAQGTIGGNRSPSLYAMEQYSPLSPWVP